jgi:hypothetical protein
MITGWKFLYIHIYKLVLKKSKKRLSLIMVEDKGFKCIMYPKSLKTDALFYTMGGCIVNLLSVVWGFGLLVSVRLTAILWIYIWSFTVFGVGIFFMNAIASTKRICNDKACYNLLRADHTTRNCHNAQLFIAKQLMDGISYRQIEKDYFNLCPYNAKNDIEAYQIILEYYYYLDTGSFHMIGPTFAKIKETNKISKDIADIIKSERIYSKIITKFMLLCNELTDIEYLDKFIDTYINIVDIEKPIKQHKGGDIHSYRVKAACEAYILYKNSDLRKVINKLNKEIEKMKRSNFVYDGEKKFCINQIRKLIENLCKIENINKY